MQRRLEHLEQGFSVYVNGANSEVKTSPRKAVHSDFSRSASQAEGTQSERRSLLAKWWFSSVSRSREATSWARKLSTRLGDLCRVATPTRLEREHVSEREKSFFMSSKTSLGLYCPTTKVRAANSGLLHFLGLKCLNLRKCLGLF